MNGSEEQGFFKTVIRKGEKNVGWEKGMKAVFDYTAFVYRKKENGRQICEHAHDDTHTHESHKHDEIDSDLDRPIRIQISDSKLDTNPFELRYHLSIHKLTLESEWDSL